MLVTRKLALVAVALLVAGCSALPTGSDAGASASAARQTIVPDSESGSEGTNSTTGETDNRGGNLFGSGT